MAELFDVKEQMSFRISFARLLHGNGPFDVGLRPRAGDEVELGGRSILYLELKGGHRKLRKLVGKRPATAGIRRHPAGQWLTEKGGPARGLLEIGEIDDDDGQRGFVSITGLLPPDTFDAVVSAFITGGRELLARSRLYIGLKDVSDEIDFDTRGGPLGHAMFLLEDLAIAFEIGEQYDELADLDE